MDLPGQEVFISSCELADSTLLFRLVTDYHPGADPAAYSVQAEAPTDPDSVLTFLQRCHAENEYVYVFERDGQLILETESGDQLQIEAKAFHSAPTNFNERELVEVADRVYQWYLSEHKALRAAQDRIHAARNLLIESARRVEIKAASHKSEGTAATLYSQQLALIQHILDVLGT